MRRRGARLHVARQLLVERGHRQEHLGEVALGHVGQDVDVARHQMVLGDDAHRIVEVAQHAQDLARDLELALDRLIGIGVGAHGHHVGPVLRRGELGHEQLGGVGLEQDLGLEVEAGRQAEIGVRRPREAVDAAVLAAAIGIDRAVERHVGRGVAREDGARGIARQRRAQRRQLVVFRRLARCLGLPAVGRADALLAVVAARLVGQRAAAVMHRLGDRIVGIIGRIFRPHGQADSENKQRTSQAIHSARID